MVNFTTSTLINKWKKGLAKTKAVLSTEIGDLIFRKKQIDENVYEALEEALIKADVGPIFADEILHQIKDRVTRNETSNPELIYRLIKERMMDVLRKCESPLTIPPTNTPFIILMVGVNGTGKTTTAGKLAYALKEEGKSVLLVAADTFRAAAIEQLVRWGERVGAPVVKQHLNADPAAVVFDGLKSALASGVQVVIVDTAGRLHTKVNLMEELKKITRVMAREIPDAPHETLLVLDATTGQNGIVQARMFHDAIGITGLILTKLDGTAKGGAIVRIASELGLPIRYVGVGEDVDDLQPFSAERFVEALFE